MTISNASHKTAFLSGVFLITFSLLMVQILQTRILSVLAWYYLAFFAVSVAMLGMTVGESNAEGQGIHPAVAWAASAKV
jgi:hypothetical protein